MFQDPGRWLLFVGVVLGLTVMLVSAVLLRGATGVATTLGGLVIGGLGVAVYDLRARKAAPPRGR